MPIGTDAAAVADVEGVEAEAEHEQERDERDHDQPRPPAVGGLLLVEVHGALLSELRSIASTGRPVGHLRDRPGVR